MEKLYDRADIYDLIESEKRTEIIRNDWKTFLGDRPIRSFLDVSIGTGGLTLPLQELGLEIYGSDLNGAMLDRCRAKARAKQRPADLRQSDFRDLSCWDGMEFDCVASTGNSLAYVSNEDVAAALRRMSALVKPGGYLCFDSRNWEKILREKQRFYFYNPFFRDDTRINLMQVWDHHADGSVTFNLLYSFERENLVVQREIFEEHYQPFSFRLAEQTLLDLGYSGLTVRSHPCADPEVPFEQMDWYRLIARKPPRN